MAGTSSNRAEEMERVSRIERNNQNESGLRSGISTVKHSGIGTGLSKNSTNSGGITRATKGVKQG